MKKDGNQIIEPAKSKQEFNWPEFDKNDQITFKEENKI